MINGGPSYEYTFNVDNHTISSSSYGIYYIHDYNDMENDFRYTFTQGKVTKETDSRKEHTRKEG